MCRGQPHCGSCCRVRSSSSSRLRTRDTLAARLHGRGDEIGAVERRLAAAERELTLTAEFDHVVVNADDGLDAAVDEVLRLVDAERRKPERVPVVL